MAASGSARIEASRRFVFLLILFQLSGCAQPRSTGTAPAVPDREADGRARLKLEEIRPVPKFPEAATDAAPIVDPASEDPRAARYFRRGRDRFDEQLWSEAVAALERALQFDPGLNEARILLARASLQHGNYGLAETHLREVLKHRPRDVAAHQMLGEIAWLQGRAEEAVSELRLAIRAAGDAPRRPEAVLAHLTLAMALRRQGYLSAAVEQFEAYLDAVEHPTDAMRAYHELKEVMALYRGKAAGQIGEIETALGHHDKAIAAYRRAAAQSPDDASLRERLIQALARSGRFDEALSAARRWATDFPEGDAGLKLLRDICALAGRPDQYDAELSRLAAEVSDPAMRMALAQRLLNREKTAEAITILERFTGVEAVRPDVGYLLGRLYARQGDLTQAYDRIVGTLRAHPETTDEALALLADSEPAQAVEAYLARAGAMAREKPADAFSRYLFGVLLAARGKTEAAVAELEAAVKLDGRFTAATVALGRVYVRQKRWHDVIELTDRAIEDGLQDAKIHLLKGLAHDALDEIDEAEAAWLEAFRLDRESAEPLYALARSAERRSQPRRCEQLYRRILDDVDPRFVPARERLIILYINTRRAERAREYFSDFKRLGLKGPAVERCRVMLDLVANATRKVKAPLAGYQSALRKILETYPDDAETYLVLATTARLAGDFDQALADTERALAIDPESLPGRELKADLQAKLLAFEEAAETIRDLLRDRPRDTGYLQKLLEFAENQGDDATVIRILRQLLARDDLKDQHPLFTGQLITALLSAKRFDEAIATAKTWLDEAPDDDLRRKVYLSALGRAGHHDEAVASARDYLAADPTNLSLRIQLIERLRAAERFTEAKQLVLRWLEEDPEEIELNMQLIVLCLLAERWDDAIELARAGAKLPHDGDRYGDWLARGYLLAGRYDEAIQFYRDRISRFERDRKRVANLLFDRPVLRNLENANFSLIRALLAAERYREAEQIINKLMRPILGTDVSGTQIERSTLIDLRSLLVDVYQNTDRAAQAIQQLEAIYELDPQDPGVNNNLGYTWADAGMHLKRAERMIRFALSQQPRSAANLDSLGWVFYKTGRFTEAARYLRRALHFADPPDPVIHDHLADALYRLGKTDEARAHWEQAAALCDPDHDPPPDRERRLLGPKIAAKLKELAGGRAVDVAEVVTREVTTRPAGDGS